MRTQERNLLYVIEVETFVSRTLRPFSTDNVEDYWCVLPAFHLSRLLTDEKGI